MHNECTGNCLYADWLLDCLIDMPNLKNAPYDTPFYLNRQRADLYQFQPSAIITHLMTHSAHCQLYLRWFINLDLILRNVYPGHFTSPLMHVKQCTSITSAFIIIIKVLYQVSRKLTILTISPLYGHFPCVNDLPVCSTLQLHSKIQTT